MQSLRQLGGGVIIAIVSVILVIGGISLALAETLPPASTPTLPPPTLPLNFPSPTPTVTVALEIPTLPTESPTDTATSLPTETLPPPVSCAPPGGWIGIITSPNDTIYSLAQRYNTSPEALSAGNCLSSINLPAGYLLYVPPVAATATVIPCGPPAGWVKNHVVQPGENLYRIALAYGITYPQLQAANCMGSSVLIYVGQRLWVPNIPTRTPVPGVTPVFATSTATATATSTIAPQPTATQMPSATPTLYVTSTSPPTATASLTSFPSPNVSP